MRNYEAELETKGLITRIQINIQKKADLMRGCPEDTHAVLFALRRVILLRSYIMLRIVILSFGQFYANKITLKSKISISLCRKAHNITLSEGKNIT